MKKYLLDFETMLWALKDSAKLGKNAREIIGDKSNIVFISMGNIWGICMRVNLGRMKIAPGFFEILDSAGYDFLDIKRLHLFELSALPNIHYDPLDRLLVAQARVEGCTLITADREIKKYEVEWISAGE